MEEMPENCFELIVFVTEILCIKSDIKPIEVLCQQRVRFVAIQFQPASPSFLEPQYSLHTLPGRPQVVHPELCLNLIFVLKLTYPHFPFNLYFEPYVARGGSLP